MIHVFQKQRCYHVSVDPDSLISSHYPGESPAHFCTYVRPDDMIVDDTSDGRIVANSSLIDPFVCSASPLPAALLYLWSYGNMSVNNTYPYIPLHAQLEYRPHLAKMSFDEALDLKCLF